MALLRRLLFFCLVLSFAGGVAQAAGEKKAALDRCHGGVCERLDGRVGPQLATTKGHEEKASSALAIATLTV